MLNLAANAMTEKLLPVVHVVFQDDVATVGFFEVVIDTLSLSPERKDEMWSVPGRPVACCLLLP